MQRTAARAILAALLGLAVALSAGTSRADDEAAGRVLFDDAMVLVNKGRLDEACPKFEESVRQSYNINAHYFLADCREKQGKTASAWTTFLKVASKAKEAGDDKREQAARKRADSLEGRLVRVKISVAQEVEGLEVRRNGSVIGRAMWSTVLPVDPGQIEFSASAPGFEPFSKSVTVMGEGRTIDVTIPELVKRALPSVTAPPTSAGASALPAAAPVAASPSQSERAADSPWRTVGWVAGGVGVAAVAVGSVLALSAKSSFDSAKSAYDACQNAACADKNLHGERDANSRANLATGFFIGGAAVAAVGLTIVIATPRSSERAASRRSLSVGILPSGLSLEGRF